MIKYLLPALALMACTPANTVSGVSVYCEGELVVSTDRGRVQFEDGSYFGTNESYTPKPGEHCRTVKNDSKSSY